ncbi:MAG: hypothetical protein ACETWM_17150 [Candidatus Lokiarchaeia archaeon]
MDYLAWNDLIAKHFFNEENAGREVLLYVNEQLLETLGSEHSVGKDDFINALKIGPPWVTRQGFCQKGLQAFTNWRSRKLKYPPYIGYLAFFVLSAGADEGFAPHAYYPNFWTLLGEPADKGTPPSFDDMILLWEDLETWSLEDMNENLGRFVARIRGGWWKVGLPLSQTIISEEERKSLPRLFVEANLDPTDLPSPEVITKLFSIYGSHIFENKTLRLLQSTEAEFSILKHALVELVLDELESWDGTVYETREEEEGKPTHRRVQAVGMRICMRYDAVAQKAEFYLRFKAGKPFPEEGLQFESKKDARVYFCMETFQGWSTPLKYRENDSVRRLDAASANWVQGEEFADKENGWRAKLRGSTTRLFRLNIDGLPDWIESQKLERGIEFYIASWGAETEKIQNWGVSSCERFKELSAIGLPPGWALFYGKDAKESCTGIDVLSISSQVRLLLKEGIKAGRGNLFFNFAPPKVVVENGTGAEKVTVNGQPMIQQNIQEPIWKLPEGFLEGESSAFGEVLRIEVKLNNLSISRIIRIINFGLPAPCDAAPFRNQFGELCGQNESSGVRGVNTNNVSPAASFSKFLPYHLSHRIVFIGSKPGQITEWPKEGFPQDWHPVWALAFKKRNLWVAHFCGNTEDASIDTEIGQPVNGRKKIKQWREALWINRKITVGPEIGQLKKVWKKYIEAASYV